MLVLSGATGETTRWSRVGVVIAVLFALPALAALGTLRGQIPPGRMAQVVAVRFGVRGFLALCLIGLLLLASLCAWAWR